MPMIRSARGELLDTALHAIKAQLAQRPVPKPVAERQAEIEEREGVKTVALPPDVVITTEPIITAELGDMLAAAEEVTAQEAKSKKR